ncbi:DUF4282 domain-containing protein [Actinomadura luteofluorescens]|uniref:DUF4282 domain-containing protein n=1 Tax=Actinomadura luteofluorescens TaxID=46163 RepID=UPI00346C794E
MTNPPDPGHPPRPQAPGGPGGPYGPPPGGPAGPFPGPGPVPGPRPPGPASGFQEPPQGWAPPPGDRGGGNVLQALFDLNFDTMVTMRVVKVLYVLALVPISLFALLMAAYGVEWIAEGGWGGYLLLLASPFVWLLQVFATRILLEFVINQFKISEYLRAIKDKG